MIKNPLYMTIEEFSEVLLNNVYAINSFEPNEKYHPTDFASTFPLSSAFTGASLDQIISHMKEKFD